MTTENLIYHSLKRGITLSDYEILTTGMIIGLITEYNNIELNDDEEKKMRIASQDDFDNF
ncbi:MAG: hypothetical protein CVU95_08275 [Firmicutes bacterium HGW-Firmicutes-2]|jgi:hypothetical protein|nr:MAG: hypothetical protein CVU95_08275 [Firmicutes bacterium HGW-Firmicutes-2]